MSNERFDDSRFSIETADGIEEFCNTGPERKLLIAIINRAILDWTSSDDCFSASAKEWFYASEVEEPEFNTFQSICNTLDLDFLKLRDAIIVYIERNKAAPAA